MAHSGLGQGPTVQSGPDRGPQATNHGAQRSWSGPDGAGPRSGPDGAIGPRRAPIGARQCNRGPTEARKPPIMAHSGLGQGPTAPGPDRGPTGQSGPDRGPTAQSGPDRGPEATNHGAQRAWSGPDSAIGARPGPGSHQSWRIAGLGQGPTAGPDRTAQLGRVGPDRGRTVQSGPDMVRPGPGEQTIQATIIAHGRSCLGRCFSC